MLFGCFAMNIAWSTRNAGVAWVLYLVTSIFDVLPEKELLAYEDGWCLIVDFIIALFSFFWRVIYFLAADRQITWRRASQTKDQAACSKECRLYVRMIFDLRCAELNWKQVAEVQNRLKNRTCWLERSSQFSVFQIVSNHITSHDATLCRDIREMILSGGTQQTYQSLQLHLRYLIPRLAVIYSLVIPDLSIFPLVI